MKKTLYDKIWNEHLVHENIDGSSLIYIDRHLVHEVTSPQAFDGLGIKKRNIWNKNSIFAVSKSEFWTCFSQIWNQNLIEI